MPESNDHEVIYQQLPPTQEKKQGSNQQQDETAAGRDKNLVIGWNWLTYIKKKKQKLVGD